MLRKYTEQDFDLLTKWVSSEELLLTFSGTDWNLPLSRQQLSDYAARNPNKYFYIACFKDCTPYGFGEVITNEPTSPRIGRLLIGKAENRSKGLGKKLVQEFVQEALKLQPAGKVYLFVLEHNKPAVACYLKCGFVFSDSAPFTISFSGKNFKILKMELDVNLITGISGDAENLPD